MHTEHNAAFKYTGIDPDVADPANQFRCLGEKFSRVRIVNGPDQAIDGIGPWQQQTTGAMRALLIPYGPGGPDLFLERQHPDGAPHVVDANGNRLEASVSGSCSSASVRRGNEMEDALRKIETAQKPYDIHDATGKKLCSITYDPLTGDIFGIHTAPYENIEKEAEHNEELVYVTEENGTPTGERITRKEARDQQRRYLLVSLLLNHGGAVCAARRSPQKKIDPGKEALSAHGMAKLLFRPDGTPISDLRYATLINTALELNEELRHGQGTQPFNVIVWPGSEWELCLYVHEHPVDDPNTVYLVGGMLFADHGYPLYEWETPRTRFIINGHVFAKDRPAINIDPSEVEESRWLPTREFALQPGLSEDALRCMEESHLAFLQAKTPMGFRHSHRWVRNAMSAMFDEEPVFEGRSD